MTDIEDRLRDAFTALDGAVTVPARRVPARRSAPWLLAAAAAIVIVVLAVTTVQRRGEPQVTVAGEVSAAAFDDLANPVCGAVIDGRAGVAPRFATAEAYVLVAEQRIDLVETALASLASLPDAPDDARLKGRVVDALNESIARAEVVLDHAEAGDVDAAVTAWPRVDRYVDRALQLLGAHGAAACRL